MKLPKKKTISEVQLEILNNIQLEMFWVVEILKMMALRQEGAISKEEYIDWVTNLTNKNDGNNNNGN